MEIIRDLNQDSKLCASHEHINSEDKMCIVYFTLTLLLVIVSNNHRVIRLLPLHLLSQFIEKLLNNQLHTEIAFSLHSIIEKKI